MKEGIVAPGTLGCPKPSPLKCFCAPRHQILAKSAPQKARKHDKADFATKVRKSSINCVNVILEHNKAYKFVFYVYF